MQFATPQYFWLLLLLLPMLLWHILGRRHKATLIVATTAPHEKRCSWFRLWRHVPFLLRLTAVVLIIIILARPQSTSPQNNKEVQGINIMMCMDISTSMLTQDLMPNRIEAAKQVAIEFISGRETDNIGLTLFGGEAFTQCPMTTDHAALLSMFKQVSCDLQQEGVISNGTAVGMGLTNAVSRLALTQAPSKVVILLTDGANNAGDISPLMAAEIAKKQGVRVYTIAVGKQGKVKQPVAILPNGEYYYQWVESDADPATLKEIADMTGGLFYTADTKAKLRAIYDDIDRLEKTKLKVQNYSRRYEAYLPFAVAAFLCVLLELILRLTLLRRIPE